VSDSDGGRKELVNYRGSTTQAAQAGSVKSIRRSDMKQADLFDTASKLPPGLRYTGELISHVQEEDLVRRFEELEFKPFEFHGFLGKRRVVSFGWRYDFGGQGLQKADDIPRFLEPVRRQAAAFAMLRASDLQHVLVTEYEPGAAIGWHKDRSVFGDVIGVSLMSPCTFRLRRKAEAGWQRASIRLEPRSVYLLRGESRVEWEHSIPAVMQLRYSITFRNFRDHDVNGKPARP
jgi:alkylated DNA repair dioxygenase AlkB